MKFLSRLSVDQLIQISKVVQENELKGHILKKIAKKLKSEDYKSLNEKLAQDIKEIFSQYCGNDIMELMEIVLKSKPQPPSAAKNVVVNLGNTGNTDTSLTQLPVIEMLDPIDLSLNRRLQEVGGNQSAGMMAVDTNRKRVLDPEHQHISSEEEEEEEQDQTRYENIQIISDKTSFNIKFKVQSSETSIKFKNIPNDIVNLEKYLKKAFDEILSFTTRNAQPYDKIGLKICLPNFNSTKPIGIHFTDVSQLKADAIASVLDSVSQSNSNFLLTDMLEINSVVLQVPSGKGKKSIPINIKRASSQDIIRHKYQSIVNIELNDEPIYCLPIAILLGKCLADQQLNKIRVYKRNMVMLKRDILSLNQLAKVKVDIHFGSTITQLASYQNVLPSYNIVVFNNKYNFKDKMYTGNDRDGAKDINIFYFEENKHFVALRNVRKFFGKRYQCTLCLDLYNYTYHLCSKKCKSCETSPPCKYSEQKMKCDKCNRYFRGQDCYNNHQNLVCSVLKFCTLCTKLIDMRKRDYKNHSCNEKLCSVCSEIVDNTHQCYVQKYKQKSPSNYSIIFYDLKCTQNLNIGNQRYLHEPNLCVAHIVCNKCFSIMEADYCCSTCKKRQHIFENSVDDNCVKKFIDFCEIFRKDSATIFCIAHNFKAYDGQFILQELGKRNKSVKPIMGGLKIFKIIYDKYITFIDSLNFIPMALSKFPETFGVENLARGWYPHLFNTSENYTYIGDVPDQKYFGITRMTDKEIRQFNVWYEERVSSGLQYNNHAELIKYCDQDVEILRKGCVVFMTDFFKITKINPLLQAFTLSQAVMHAFRKTFLKENTLGIVPTSLYHEYNKNQSRAGLKWLIWESKKCNDTKILYEVNIPTTKFYVDGYCKETNTVYEFLGCYWHGCKICFLKRAQYLNGCIKNTFDIRYDQTILRLDFIASLGYKIIKIWQCEFTKFLIENPQISELLENDPELLYGYLNPRDALYGGRIETFHLYYKAKPGEKIRYYDFTSLYPYVNKTGKNPIHHPKIYYKDGCKNLNISCMDGLIKCSILPPQDLLIPILPTKINNKLLFTLCRTCAETINITSPCCHNESERMLIGTWVLDEVKLAINNRYKIYEIFEVWEYQISQYDTDKKTGGVFTDYMNCFLKIKQEASDWPGNIKSETEKSTYIEEFFKHEGITLDPTAITSNPSQRDCSKLSLNTLWGKFTQKNDRSQTEIIQTLSDLYSLVSSPGVVILGVIPVKDVLWVNWKYVNADFVEPLKHVSLPIGAFTTASARIKLYSELCKIPTNLLYCDTDAILFVEDTHNKEALKIGNFIGDLTDELSAYGKNAFITEFVSTGPKCYAYIVFNPDNGEYFEVSKCKGITYNNESKKVLNDSTLKSMVINMDDDGVRVVHDKKKIKRQKMLKVNSEAEAKSFGFTNTKRICVDDFKTIPFGYQ